ncbi:MAG: STAS domain-containing protein [Coriobacteriales bacterium]|jgi:anti-sigma B factor antagonist|nr:STAS domain-containing protein [Coriobacteriales bacterium]
MDISATDRDGAHIIHISGRLDTLTAPELEEPLRQAIEKYPAVVLDCERLDYVSSAGLRVLLTGQKTAIASGHSFALSGVSDAVHEVFDMTGFSDILQID